MSEDAVPLFGTPFAVAISPQGVLYVTLLHAASAARAELPDTHFTASFSVGALPSQVRFSPDGRTAYVGNQDARTVTFITIATNEPFDTLAVPAGSILTLGLSPDGGRLYALTDFHGVYVIDALARRVIDSIPGASTGDILTGVAFHPTAPRMYIAARDLGAVTTINTETNAVLKTDTVTGGRIQNVAVSLDGGSLFGTDIERSKLITWDLASGGSDYLETDVGTPMRRNAFDVAVTPDNAQIYVSTLADGKVYVLDRATRAPLGAIATGGNARYIAFNRTGTLAVIANEMGWVSIVH